MNNSRLFYIFAVILLLTFPAMARTLGKAKDFSVDTSTFDKNLDVTDNTVQKALERLDETLGGTGEVILRVNGVQASYANLKDSTGGVAFALNGSDITAAFTELDPVFGAWDKSTGISITESQISDLKTYLTTESDPMVTTHESTYDHSLIATALQAELDPGVTTHESMYDHSAIATALQAELDPGVTTHESTYDHSLIATALQVESDPVFTASEAAKFSSGDKLRLDGIETGANNYSLPTASTETLGGVKVGEGLSISNGVLEATSETDPVFSASEAFGFEAGDKSKLDGIELGANNYTLPTASSSTLGGIKVGDGLSITNGVLSASGGSTTIISRAYVNESSQIVLGSSETIIEYDYITYEVGTSAYSGWNVYDDYKYQSPSDGYYKVTARFKITNITAGTTFTARIRSYAMSSKYEITSTSTDDITIELSDIFYLEADDTVWVTLTHNGENYVSVLASPEYSNVTVNKIN